MMKKKIIELVLIFAIVAANLVVVRGLFSGVYTAHVSSIESQYFSHIKFITENFPRIWWQPFWYGGFPFFLFYQPVLPFVLSLVKLLTGLPTSEVYRFSIGIFYILGSLATYLLLWDMTERKVASFCAALIYSLGPSVVGLIPVISNQEKAINLAPWRLVVLTLYGEGAHIWGLAVIPIGLLFFRRLVKNESFVNWIMAVGSGVVLILTSITAFMPFLILVFVLWVTEAFGKNFKKNLLTLVLFLLFTYVLSSFWYNLPFLGTLFGFAQSGAGGIFNGIWGNPVVVLFIFIPVLAVFSFTFGPKLAKSSEARLWAVGILSFTLIFFSTYFRYCCNVALLPLPLDYLPRFGPEVELVFVIVAAVVLASFENKVDKSAGKFSISIKAVIYFIIGILIAVSFSTRLKDIRELTAANTDIYQTSEYRIAKWLTDNDDGSRVYATGTHAQWLNFWGEVPQLRGAADQAIVNHLWPHVIYQIYWGDEGKLAVDWLEAVGIKYIVVNSAQSKVFYKDYRFPDKFDGLAKLVYEYEGDKVYLLPTKKTELVLGVSDDKISKIGKITSVLDKNGLQNYLLATENDAGFGKVSYIYKKPWDNLKIDGGSWGSAEEIIIRINDYSGWVAKQGNRGLKIESDPLGFMIIRPADKGDIYLSYGLPFNVKIGYLESAAGLVAFVLFLRRRFALSRKMV